MPLTVGPTFGVQNPGEQGFRDFFKANGVDDHEAPYWASKWDELQQRGQQLGDPNYANRFLSNAEVFTGSPEATARNMWGTNGQASVMNPNNGFLTQLMQMLNGQQGNMKLQNTGAQPYNPHAAGQQNKQVSNYFGNSGMQPTGQTDGTLLGTQMSGSQNTIGSVGQSSVSNPMSAQPKFDSSNQQSSMSNPMGAPSFYKTQPTPTKALPDNNLKVSL